MTQNYSFSSLPSYDDLFTSQEERDEKDAIKIQTLPINEIQDFKQHTFQIRDDEEMQELVASIKEVGVVEPCIAFKNEDGEIELVSGHRRKRACQLAGVDTLPVIIKELNRDQAVILMGEANRYRKNILPSELAKTYKAMITALNHQGKRSDLFPTEKTLTQTREEVSEMMGVSQLHVWRIVQLNKLIPEWLDLVDKGNKGGMGIRQGVELSALDSAIQKMVYEYCVQNEVLPTHAQAIQIKEAYKSGYLDEKEIESILSAAKPNQIEHVKISLDRIQNFFPKNTKKKDMEKIIVEALELWKRREMNRHREV